MRRFLKSLFLFSRTRPFTDKAQWSSDDEAALRAFFNTPTGQRLHANMVNSSFEQDRWATLQSRNVEHAAGFACGWRACVAHLEAFTGVPPDEEQDKAEATKGAESLEHLHP